MAQITIDNATLNEIMVEAGFPILSVQDLGFTEDDIKDLCVYPALREYFKWYPKKLIRSYQVAETFSIPYPENENVYGVVGAKIALSGYLRRSGNPFIDQRRYLVTERQGRRWGKASASMIESQIMRETENKSYINIYRTGRIDLDRENQLLTGSTNLTGELVVTWACFSNDFADVEYSQVQNVISLSTAKVLRMLGMLRGQQNQNNGIEFNHDLLLQRASDLEEKVMETWKNRTKIVVLR